MRIQTISKIPIWESVYFCQAADSDGAPEVVKQCLRLLKSDAMFLLLSNLTGIRLHPLAPVDDDDDDEEEEGREGEEVPEEVLEREKSPLASSSKMEEEKATDKKEQDKEKEKGREKGAKKRCVPKCAAEVRRWKQARQIPRLGHLRTMTNATGTLMSTKDCSRPHVSPCTR